MTHQPSARVLSTRSQVIPGSPWCDLLKWSRCNFSVCQGPTLPGLMTLHILDPVVQPSHRIHKSKGCAQYPKGLKPTSELPDVAIVSV